MEEEEEGEETKTASVSAASVSGAAAPRAQTADAAPDDTAAQQSIAMSMDCGVVAVSNSEARTVFKIGGALDKPGEETKTASVDAEPQAPTPPKLERSGSGWHAVPNAEAQAGSTARLQAAPTECARCHVAPALAYNLPCRPVLLYSRQ